MTPGRAYFFLGSYFFSCRHEIIKHIIAIKVIPNKRFFDPLFSCCSLLLYFIPTGFEERIQKNAVRCRGRVIAVDNSDILQTEL
jgi:hypothetical protein